MFFNILLKALSFSSHITLSRTEQIRTLSSGSLPWNITLESLSFQEKIISLEPLLGPIHTKPASEIDDRLLEVTKEIELFLDSLPNTGNPFYVITYSLSGYLLFEPEYYLINLEDSHFGIALLILNKVNPNIEKAENALNMGSINLKIKYAKVPDTK